MTEKISSLVDGELSRDELAAACASLDADALRTAERYQLIGSLMRNDCREASLRLYRDDIASRIGASIAGEPEWLLPAAGRREASAPRPRHGFAFVGGFASAAAIAAVAIMVVAPNWLGAPGEAPASLASAGESASPTGATPMDVDALNALLVEHGEFTGSAGLNGLVAYAKFVSHGSE